MRPDGVLDSLIKLLFQPWRRTTQSSNDLLRPFDILTSSLDRPVRCGAVCHGPQVAGLISDLDQLRFTAFLFGILDLLALALCFWQRLVVGDFHDDLCDLWSKLAGNRFRCDA